MSISITIKNIIDRNINAFTESELITLRKMLEKIEALKASRDKLVDALQKLDNWAKAYPLDVFPEPDFSKVRKVLKAAGLSLDVVSASNMRHVLDGIKDIVEQALKEGKKIK